MDDSFGNWLAGFIDGEGCFHISIASKEWYGIKFTLKLRADDEGILREIVEKTKIGYVEKYTGKSVANANPQSQWRVNSQVDCLKLIELLEKYPLRAKKKRDFDIWKKAVKYLANAKRGHKTRGRRDLTPIKLLRDKLKNTRMYEQMETDYNEINPQLSLF